VTAGVLVVDDNADYRLLVRLALARGSAFHVVAESSRGTDAIELAASLQPDVALVDLAMNGTDGLALLAPLHHASPITAVVGVSAFPQSELRALPHAGSVGFLSKDVRPSRLSDELALMAGMLTAVEQARTTVLAPDPESPRAARRFVDDALTGWQLQEVLDTAQLLVSEVVTNAIMHGRTEAEVSVRLLGDRVRVEVVDHATSMIRRRPDDPTATSGRGTGLVDALSNSWGVDDVASGKKVWFELNRPAS
jgi:DNA-binding NarL/FixJ family response regulator